jgi:hypothetical protein
VSLADPSGLGAPDLPGAAQPAPTDARVAVHTADHAPALRDYPAPLRAACLDYARAFAAARAGDCHAIARLKAMDAAIGPGEATLLRYIYAGQRDAVVVPVTLRAVLRLVVIERRRLRDILALAGFDEQNALARLRLAAALSEAAHRLALHLGHVDPRPLITRRAPPRPI